MTLSEIKQAVENGQRVFHHNVGYEVIKDSVGQWLIKCASNDHCIGLTWRDGVTMNGKPEDFFIEQRENELMSHTPTPWVVKHEPADGLNGERFYICKDGDCSIVVTCGRLTPFLVAKAKVNAEHIVLCVNAHDSLVEALQFVESSIAERKRGGLKPDPAFRDWATVEFTVLEALKLAKGKKQ